MINLSTYQLTMNKIHFVFAYCVFLNIFKYVLIACQ